MECKRFDFDTRPEHLQPSVAPRRLFREKETNMAPPGILVNGSKNPIIKEPSPLSDIKPDSDDAMQEEDQVVPCVESSASSADSNNFTLVQPSFRITGFKNEVEFNCKLCFKPEMLRYYYSPGPHACSSGGGPVLLGTPVFDGGWGTKWRLNFTIDRWIGIKRWMSLYLTRLDDQDLLQLAIQCQFTVIDDKENPLYSQRNVLEASSKGETCGFTQFLPFEEVLKMINKDNTLHIIAHLTLVLQMLYFGAEKPTQESVKGNNDIDNSGTTTLIDDVEDISDNWSVTNASNSNEGVDMEDRVELHHKNEFVISVNRETLRAKSKAYQMCLELDWDAKNKINFCTMYESDAKERKIMREYVDFIEREACATLESGSYEDVHLLFQFAKKMETKDLVTRCITAMTMKITPATAAVHIAVIYNVDANLLHKEDLQVFETFFKERFNDIRKTDGFKRLARKYSSEFVHLVFAS